MSIISEDKYTYHCDYCGELFQSQMLPTESLKCIHCGKHPTKKKIARISKAAFTNPNMVDKRLANSSYDIADTFAKKRYKERMRMVTILTGWAVVLGGIMTYKIMKLRNHEEKLVQTEEIKHRVGEYRMLIDDMSVNKAVAKRFHDFTLALDRLGRSNQIVDGNDHLLELDSYYDGKLYDSDLTSLRLLESRYEPDSDKKKISALFAIPNSTRLQREAIFWKIEDKWLLDWNQFVRYAGATQTLNDYVKNPDNDTPEIYMVYVRLPQTSIHSTSDLIEFALSEPINDHDRPSTHSTYAYIRKDTPEGTKIKREIMRGIRLGAKPEYRIQFKQYDPLGSARLRVRVGFEDYKGARRLFIHEVLANDWCTPPSAYQNKK